MNFRSRLLPWAALALAVAVATPLWAAGFGGGLRRPGGGPPAGRLIDRLDAYLELTDAQEASARQIFDAARDQGRPIREEQRDLHERLRAALDADPQDASAVGALAISLHAHREQLRTIRERARADFAALLTADQKVRLDALKDARGVFGRGGRRGHGPHGPGPGFGRPGGPGAPGDDDEDGFGFEPGPGPG